MLFANEAREKNSISATFCGSLVQSPPSSPPPLPRITKSIGLRAYLAVAECRRISQYTHTFKHANGNPRDEVEKDIFDLNRVSEKKDEI